MSRRKRKNHSQFSLFVFQDIITCVMGIMLLLTLMLSLQISTVAVQGEQSDSRQTISSMQQMAVELSAEVMLLEQSLNDQTALLNSGALEDAQLLRTRSVALKTDNELASQDVRSLWQQQTGASKELMELQQVQHDRRDQVGKTKQMQSENEELSKTIQELSSGRRVLYNAHTGAGKSCWVVEMTDEKTFLAAELEQSGTPLAFATRSALVQWILQRHRTGAVFMLIVKPSAASDFESIAPDLRGSKVTFGFDLLPDGKTVIDPVQGVTVP